MLVGLRSRCRTGGTLSSSACMPRATSRPITHRASRLSRGRPHDDPCALRICRENAIVTHCFNQTTTTAGCRALWLTCTIAERHEPDIKRGAHGFLPRHDRALDEDDLTSAHEAPTLTPMAAGIWGRAQMRPVSMPPLCPDSGAPGVAPGAVQPLAQGAARQEFAHQPAVLRRLQHRACATDSAPVNAPTLWASAAGRGSCRHGAVSG